MSIYKKLLIILIKYIFMVIYKKMLNIINWTWEFPQTLLGWIIIKFIKVYSVNDFNNSKLILMEDKTFGVSLGRYILLRKNALEISKKHEYGHCIQSKYLGPLYLIIIGLPSITLNIISRILGGNFANNYYNRFPENWADKLGGVVRNK